MKFDLEDLAKMSPEEGVAMMKQFFNPLRGRAVGYLGDRGRKQARPVAQMPQNKVAKETDWSLARQGDLFGGWSPIYSRVQEEKQR